MKIAIVFSQSGALNFFTYMIIHGIAARDFLTFFLLRCFYRLGLLEGFFLIVLAIGTVLCSFQLSFL